MVVGTAIFTLPGIVAAEHTGPAVPLAFIVAAIGLDCRPGRRNRLGTALCRLGLFLDERLVRRILWLDCRLGPISRVLYLSCLCVASGWSAYMQGFSLRLGLNCPPP